MGPEPDDLHGDDLHGDGPASDAEADALDHLWGAAHEMLRALRMLIDAADEFVESQRAEPRTEQPRRAPEQRGGRVHHIDIEAS